MTDRDGQHHGPGRPLLLPVGYLVIGLVWFVGATLLVPAVLGEVGPAELTEALIDLVLFVLAVGIAAVFEVRYRASVRRALRARQVEERRWRAIFQASPAAIVIVNRAGVIIEANGRVQSLLG